MRHLTFLFALLILFSCSSPKQEISEFRGPGRSGIYPSPELLKSWPENGPEEVFYVDSIGNGYGSPVFSDDMLFVAGTIDSTAVLYCFDLEGTLKWKTKYGKEWSVNFPGSRSTPTIVDDMIYLGSGFGNLYCFNKEDGSVIWSKSYESDFQGVLPRFGHSESPLVDGDLVFWTPGGSDFNVVALNRINGELVWSSKGVGERSAYNSPVLIETESGRKIISVFSAYHLLGLDRENGELLWTHEQTNYPDTARQPGMGDTHGNMVVYEDGYIYYVEGDGNCAVKLRLADDGSSVEQEWQNEKFDCYMGGVVKDGDYLYASATRKRQFLSLDIHTGEIIDSLEIGRGSLIMADSMFYFYNWRGQTYLVGFENGKLNEVSSFKIDKGSKEHFAHPVMHKGVLYIRHGSALMGFDVKES